MDLHLTAQLAEILRQIKGERIVVVEQQNHLRFFRDFFLLRLTPPAVSLFPSLCAASRAVNSALALLTLSWNSPSGVESATIPPPACTCATPFFTTIVRSAMQESRLPARSKYKTPPA